MAKSTKDHKKAKSTKTLPSMLMEEQTLLDHRCRLDFSIPATHRRFTSIVCTISKKSQDFDTIFRMIQAGMNIVRLNFSHDSQEFHAKTIDLVRKAASKYSGEVGYTVPVGIAVDTKGPEIRTGSIEGNEEIELRKNDTVRLSTNKDLIDKCNRDAIYVDYPNIIYVVKPGDNIFLNDGEIALVVREVAVDCLICGIETGGRLGSRKGVNLPNIDVDLPTVSEKDRVDLKFGVRQNVDFVFAACIRSAAAIAEIREILGEKGKDIGIVAKIENVRGLENMNEIIAAADGILVARVDIGIQVPMEKMFLAQKALISRCNLAGKPVICGTQIMDSMYSKPKPTRPEVADVGNSILDGADAIMLSSETAIGAYPVECVEVLAKTCREAECALWYQNTFQDLIARGPALVDASHAVAISAVEASRKTMAVAIIVLTKSGRSAYLLGKYRPRCPILALTHCARSSRQVHLHRGVIPIVYPGTPNKDWLSETESRIQYAMLIGRKMGIVETGDSVVLLSSWKDGVGFSNNMRVVYAFFENEWIDCMLKLDKDYDEKNIKELGR